MVIYGKNRGYLRASKGHTTPPPTTPSNTVKALYKWRYEMIDDDRLYVSNEKCYEQLKLKGFLLLYN